MSRIPCRTAMSLSVALLTIALTSGCGGAGGATPILDAVNPLHLEDHLGTAQITGSEVPSGPSEIVEWRFDRPQPDWKVAPSWNPTSGSAALTATGEALRVTLTDPTRNPWGIPVGGIYISVPDWDPGEWAAIVLRVRSDSSVNFVELAFNLREGRGTATDFPFAFQQRAENSPIVRDGTVQTYRLRLAGDEGMVTGPLRELAIWFNTDGKPGSVDVLSISAEPSGEAYRDPPLGMRPVTLGNRIRRTLYMHAPGRIAYRVRVPPGGRLNTGLGVVRSDVPVSFRVHVQPARGEAATVLDVKHASAAQWAQHSVDLSRFAGQVVTLSLETASDKEGSVALWGAPTLSGTESAAQPNIIFYVIDGGSADQMSVFGYNRRTTPNLERLAQEGAVFEHAYSNSRWTQPSTTSFMTSLQSSVIGSFWNDFEALPEQARTMAERFHDAGFQTAVFASNPWAGSLSNLERGVDVFRDHGAEQDARSSEELQREYWDWRAAYAGQPYWVHFQTTDVHRPRLPLPPFAGLFATPQLAKQHAEWSVALGRWFQRNPVNWVDLFNAPQKAFSESGVDRVQYFDAERSIYDESVAHQDHELGRLVEQLKERGEWGNTLLVIGGDHSIRHAGGHFDIAVQDSVPPAWQDVVFRAGMSHVPLIFIWPGHIPGGQRFAQPVSNIDILPTVLELAGLPQPEVLQGQSLAPLMLGRPWQPRPVILEIFSKDTETGALSGEIAVIDRPWAASLWIGPAGTPGTWSGRPMPLLLFDWQNDPNALHLMNDERPDLVKKYTEFLEQQWSVHQLLAKQFTAGATIELTAAQLETLRALGYIR